MTYWQVNLVFLAVVAVVLVVWIVRSSRSRIRLPWAAIAATMAVLLVMTAVFDNIMIGVGLVGYDAESISGAFIGIAPLEDFAYAIAAVLLLPAAWSLLGRATSTTAASTTAASTPADPQTGRTDG